MNFFTKNRLIFWLLIFLLVINISALVSFFLFTKPQAEPVCCTPEEQQCVAFRDELDLTSEQSLQVSEINRKYMEFAGPLAADIKDARALLLTELEQDTPDTIQLNALTDQIVLLQHKIQMENIRQYQALKRVCNPEQAHRLSALYRDLYGCPMQSSQGQHRYRHGQGNSGKSECK